MNINEHNKVKKTFLKTLIILTVFCITTVSGLSQEYTPSFQAAVSEYRDGNYQKAFNILEKILQIEPDNYYARYYLAISLVKLKKIDEAKKYYMDIITNADDPTVVEYSRNGLKLLDPKYDEKAQKTSIIEVNKTEKNQLPLVSTSAANTSNRNTSKTLQLNEQQKALVNEIAQKNKIDPNEINNLLQILAKNPSALKTINQLANTNNANDPNNFDPESVAKLIKMMTLNNEMGLLNATDNNNNNNDNNDNNSSMDLMSLMSGQNGFNNKSSPNNNMQQLMNYMNNSTNKGKMNPDILNMLFKNNMFSDTNMNGF